MASGIGSATSAMTSTIAQGFGVDYTDPTSVEAQLGSIFDQMDTSGSGYVTDAEITQAAPDGQLPPEFQNVDPNTIVAQLDPNNTGRVSRDDFITGLSQMMEAAKTGKAHGHHHHPHGTASSDEEEPASDWQILSQALSGDSGASAGNGATDPERGGKSRSRLGL